ncbi:MAG: cytochrome c-type biogenesis protein CcmH [Gammaproteobacteria bacterium]|nr:cytochrome c-type biogenesis protein CcmH [Gammaproteobacteria bacterium]MDH5800838.1 cytochrome c-type biogenesis protein CcmH [Gammaproteobacteria bacterium]
MLKIISKAQCYCIIIFLGVCVLPAQAKEAASMAADPALEKQVMEISEELRCLVCQNQTIAESDAGLAVDLKNQVRNMVSQGKSQDEIVDYMVERYGDFVRYRPPVKPVTYLLWAGPFILLFVGALVLFLTLKGRKQQVKDTPLSDEEQERLQAILAKKMGANSDGGEEVKS